jgi:hypothetical protein
MQIDYVIRAYDGYACHIESVRGVTLCGRSFDITRDDIDREAYDISEVDEDHPHAYICMDCHSSHNRQHVARSTA